MSHFVKTLALCIIIALLLIALFNLFQNPAGRGPQANLAFSDFLAEVDGGNVRDVTIQGATITGHFADGRSFSTYAPEDPSLVGRLSGRGVRITAAPVDDSMPWLLAVLVSWFPMLLLIVALPTLARWLSADIRAMVKIALEAREELARLADRIEQLELAQRAFDRQLAGLAPRSEPAEDH